MQIPKKLLDLLDENKVAYELLRHPEAYTAQELAAAEHVKGRYHAKVVVVKCDGDLMMAVTPSDRRVDLRMLEKVLGKPVELAHESEFAPVFPDCAVGAMPPFGSLYGRPVLVDNSLKEDDFIVFEAGTHTDAIKIDFQDFERLENARYEDFTQKIQ